MYNPGAISIVLIIIGFLLLSLGLYFISGTNIVSEESKDFDYVIGSIALIFGIMLLFFAYHSMGTKVSSISH